MICFCVNNASKLNKNALYNLEIEVHKKQRKSSFYQVITLRLQWYKYDPKSNHWWVHLKNPTKIPAEKTNLMKAPSTSLHR